MTDVRMAVDVGDTGVAAAVGVGGEVTEPALELAAVFAPADGDGLVTGHEARRRAAADPARYERAPRRRVDTGPLLLGTRTVGAVEALGAVLAAAVDRAGPALRGERPRTLVLTHPVGWGTARREVLRRAGAGLATEVVLVGEPVAAAAHAAWMAPRRGDGRPVAILDVGARRAQAAVVVPDAAGDPDAAVLAARESDHPAGDHADELLLAHVLSGLPDGGSGVARLHEIVAGASLPDRRHRQVLVDDVRAARERLSDAEQAEIPLPGGMPSAWCSRGEMEDLLREPCEGLVELLVGVLDDAGLDAGGLSGIRLIGGPARTPLLGTLVHRELGVPPVVPPEPRSVVARGALLAAARATAGRGAAPPAPARTGPAPWRAPASVGPVGAWPGAPPVPPLAPLPPVPLPAPLPPVPLPGGGASGGRVPSRAEPSTGPIDTEGPTMRLVHPLTAATGRRSGAELDPRAGRRSGAELDPLNPSLPRRDVPDFAPARAETPGAAASPRGSRRRALAAAGAAVAVVLAGLGIAGLSGPGSGSPARAAPSTVSAFDHAYELPPGWEADGTEAATRRSRVRPVGQPTGPNLVAVQESPLAAPDPEAARAQLLAGFDAARAAGGGVSDLQPRTTFAGREVTRYRQVAAPGTTVEWIVVFAGSWQLSVGCRHGDTDRDAVLAACARVVETLRSPP